MREKDATEKEMKEKEARDLECRQEASLLPQSPEKARRRLAMARLVTRD